MSTGDSGGEEWLTENVTLNFARVELDCAPQTDDTPQYEGWPRCYNSNEKR